uniref:Secreted protein n=1 Tax=Rhizophora mucronata TaxID=61149 RepID=A0A2P2PVQ4_RHIMU
MCLQIWLILLIVRINTTIHHCQDKDSHQGHLFRRNNDDGRIRNTKTMKENELENEAVVIQLWCG